MILPMDSVKDLRISQEQQPDPDVGSGTRLGQVPTSLFLPVELWAKLKNEATARRSSFKEIVIERLNASYSQETAA